MVGCAGWAGLSWLGWAGLGSTGWSRLSGLPPVAVLPRLAEVAGRAGLVGTKIEDRK